MKYFITTALAILVLWLGGSGRLSGQVINTFPYFEDFNSWTIVPGFPNVCTIPAAPSPANAHFSQAANGTEDDRDWLTWSGPTWSIPTGPTANNGADCDGDSSNVGQYIYVEASGCTNTGEGWLISDRIDMTSGPVKVSFCYHMYGVLMGDLHFDVSTDDGASWVPDVVPSVTDDVDLWQHRTVSLVGFPHTDSIRIRFRYEDTSIGPGWTADCAIDNVLIEQLIPVNAGVVEVLDPPHPVCALGGPVSAVIRNSGFEPLGSLDVNLTIGGNLVTTVSVAYPVNDSLQPGELDTVLLDSAASWNLGDTLLISTALPNGVPDPDPSDDQAVVDVSSLGMCGIYTIDPSQPASATNYQSFGAIVTDLINLGVCCPVVVDVAAGTYQEQLALPEVAGMSTTNTVTFRSAQLDNSTVQLNYTSTDINDNYTVLFEGGSHFRFHHMTISNNGLFFNRVAVWNGTSSDNHLEHNVLRNPVNVNSTSIQEVVIYSTTDSDNNDNLIAHNRIVNGSYGIWWQGLNVGPFETGNRFIDNRFVNFYFNGSFMQYQEAPVFDGNAFRTTSPAPFESYAMRFVNISGPMSIQGNRVEVDPNGPNGQPHWGLQCNGCFSTQWDPIVVRNNAIHVGDPAVTNPVVGVEWGGSGPAIIANNSVNVEGDASHTRALRMLLGSQNEVVNNVFANTGPQGVAVWYSDAFGIHRSDYNDLWSTTGDLAAFGGGFTLPPPEANLGLWQLATSLDSNSVSTDPLFFSANDLHTCADDLDQAGNPAFAPPADFEGEPRDPNLPDIGADEFIGLAKFSLGPDTIVCGTQVDFEVLGAQSVTWSTGQTAPAITVTSSQIPLVATVVGSCGVTGDSVVVDFLPRASLPSDTHLCADQSLVLDAGVSNALYGWSTGSNNQSIVTDTAGTYIVVVTDTANSCISADTAVVTKSSPVNLGPDTAFCDQGVSVNVSAALPQGVTWQWNTNATTPTIMVQNTGVYAVTVTDSAGCTTSDSVAISFLNVPTASFTQTTNFLTAIFTNTSSVSGTVSYLWTFGDGDSSTLKDPIHVYPNSGLMTYPVILRVSNECALATYLDSITVGPVGIPEQLASQGVAIFPNPASGSFQVVVAPAASEAVTIELLDLQGRV
ncbi:MAG: PKD domain-containing protein, partial [Bacteroidota bacterium]